MWVESRLIEKEVVNVPSVLVKLPEAYEKDTKWKQWDDSEMAYLNPKTGHASMPLVYIIWDQDVPMSGLIYAKVHYQLVSSAILYGTKLNTNNCVVYNSLQSLTLNGPLWSWINAYQWNRDGREAWNSLMTYHEVYAIQTRSKQEYHEVILKAPYQCVK